MPRQTPQSIAARACSAAAQVLLFVLLVHSTVATAAPKTDVVVFDNGDRLTGEIKGMERGRLELSTDNLGTVYIEWDKVATIRTNQYVEIETTSGARQFGHVPQAPEAGSVSLLAQGGDTAESIPMPQVIRIQPIAQGTLANRLDGYVTVGFDYAKADSQTQFNFSGGINSRNEVREWSVDGRVRVNAQSTADTTSMYDVTAANRRFLKSRWFTQGFATVQGNQELGLDIREVLGAGIGRYVIQDARSEWAAVIGLAANHENFRDESPKNSLEAVLATQYSFFRYDTPKRSFDAGLALFPSLTDAGRLRAQADIDTRYEIVKDLFFDVSFYATYDSDADSDAASNYDYGLVTSLGYTF